MSINESDRCDSSSELRKKRRRALADAFDALPCSIVVTNDKGIVIFKNRIAVKFMSLIKEGANIIRYSGIDLSKEGVIFREFYGKKSLVMVMFKSVLDENCKILSIYPNFMASDERAAEYCRNNDSEMTALMREILEKAYENTPDDDCRRYITFLQSSIGRMNACRTLVKDYLHGLRNAENNRENICMPAMLFRHIEEYMSSANTGLPIKVSTELNTSLCCRMNCFELAYIQVCMVCFTTIFTKSKTLKFTVEEDGEDILITASLRMTYKIYRVFLNRFYSGNGDKVSYLFFPLATINAIAERNGCSVSYFEDGSNFCARLRVKSTANLPPLVRANDSSISEALDFFDRMTGELGSAGKIE